MRDRAFYEETVKGYMAAVDSLDPDAALAFFSEDPVLLLEPMGVVMRGRGEVRAAFAGLAEASAGMRHEILRLVVDVEQRIVAIELNYHDTPKDGGPKKVLHDATHAHFDADGKIQRVQVWFGQDVA
jgi:ketosteroid isomerase-like protein